MCGAKIRAFLCLCRIHTRLAQVVGMDHPAVELDAKIRPVLALDVFLPVWALDILVME